MNKNDQLLTYKDWLAGKIEANEIKFLPDEWKLIVRKQKSLFKEAVDNEVEELISNFEERNDSSLDPGLMLHNEIDWLKEILYGNKPIRKNKQLRNGYSMPVIDQELTQIRYLFRLLADGSRPDFGIIEFPDMDKSKKAHPELESVIVTQALHRYYLWLNDLSVQTVKKPDFEILTSKQQILVIYYLAKYKIIDLDKLHPDISGQSRVIHALLNREEGNVAKYLREVRTDKLMHKYFTIENLETIKKVFLVGKQEEIVNEIESELNKLKLKKI